VIFLIFPSLDYSSFEFLMHNQTIQADPATPLTDPTAGGIHGQQAKGFSTKNFNMPKLEHSYLA
jgi:hypothetical protein